MFNTKYAKFKFSYFLTWPIPLNRKDSPKSFEKWFESKEVNIVDLKICILNYYSKLMNKYKLIIKTETTILMHLFINSLIYFPYPHKWLDKLKKKTTEKGK